jgi:hypothetical protein
MSLLRKTALSIAVAAGGFVALAGSANAQFYYESQPRYYEQAPRYYDPGPRYAPQPRYYQPERQYYRQPGYGGGGGYYVDRDTALRNARALKEAQKRAIKNGYAPPGVYSAPTQRYAAPAPRNAPNSGYYGQTPGARGPTGPSNEDIYRNRN